MEIVIILSFCSKEVKNLSIRIDEISANKIITQWICEKFVLRQEVPRKIIFHSEINSKLQFCSIFSSYFLCINVLLHSNSN